MIGAQAAVVSSYTDRDRDELVMLVDRRDRVRGPAGKLEVHREGLLHRAFSIFVFNPQGQLLLQQRADCKYHFAGLWSNTCCGHPRPGEATPAAAGRRLHEEFGFSTDLREFAQIVYHARDPVTGLVEYEYLHVMRGTYEGEPRPNDEEVGDWRWQELRQVRRQLNKAPECFTPWFALLFKRVFAVDLA